MKRKSRSSQRPTLNGEHRENISEGLRKAHAKRIQANHRNFMNSLNANARRQQEAEARQQQEAEANAAESSESEADDESNADPPMVQQPPQFVEQDCMPIIPNLDILDDEEVVDEDLAEEEPERTIMHRYLEAILKRLQYETSPKFPALENKWLNELLKKMTGGSIGINTALSVDCCKSSTKRKKMRLHTLERFMFGCRMSDGVHHACQRVLNVAPTTLSETMASATTILGGE